MNILITCIGIIIILLFFVKMRWGISIYLLFLIFVPFGGKIFGFNSEFIIPLSLILATFYNSIKRNKITKYDFTPFKPFILLYLFLFLEIIFQQDTPLMWQFKSWEGTIASTLILPIAMWNVSRYDNKSIKLFRNTIIISTIIIALYGLYLTTLNGDNPYIFYMAMLPGKELREAQFGEQSNRLLIKISSVFPHPMTFGLFISLICVYIYTLKEKIGTIITSFIMFLLVSCIFFSGIRTPIATLFISIALYTFMTRRIKLIFYLIFISIIIYFTLNSIYPAVFETIESIFSSNNNEKIGGSSADMRIDQLLGCFTELSSNPLFGKGFGWNVYYLSSHENGHPTILYFESLIYVILCNFGLIGLIIWIWCFKKLFSTIKQLSKSRESYILLIILIVAYLSYSLITGEYGYMKYFVLIYTLILIEISQKCSFNHPHKYESKNNSTLSTPIPSYTRK